MLEDLETPHAVVDLERVEENVARVHGYAKEHRLALRPHTKTHKDPELGRLQIARGAAGLTVATPLEAEVMSSVSKDLLVVYPPVERHRRERLLSLDPDVSLTVALDSPESLDLLRGEARRRGRVVRVLVELDLGGRRTGVASPSDLLALARAARSEWTPFGGVLFHPGDVRAAPRGLSDGGVTEERDAFLRAEQSRVRRALSPFLEALDREGVAVETVSGGNTPTLFHSHEIPELTEIRPGTYVYSDRDIATQGVLPFSSCAYTVLATVVSTSVAGQAVIDAGTKAIAKEPITGLDGYGVLLDHPDVVVSRMSEEHGILDLTHTTFRPKLGDRVRVVPNHVCLSVHLQDRIAFVRGDDVRFREVPARGRAKAIERVL